LDNSLRFPAGDFFLVGILVNSGNLEFAVAEMLLSEFPDSFILEGGNVRLSPIDWGSASVFEREEIVRVVGFSPFVKSFPGNAKVSRGLGNILAFSVVIEPSDSGPGFTGKSRVFINVISHSIERDEVIHQVKA
jgi:hypothetical protein